MNEHEIYVTFETAKMLKEAGFDWECFTTYPLQDGEFEFRGCADNWNVKLSRYASAPTLDIAQKWLREVHHLHITIFSSSQESWMFRITKLHQKLEDGVYGEDFYTYEEAQEAGIQQCLTRLLKEKK